jgi:ribosomal protein L11 methyltransferase
MHSLLFECAEAEAEFLSAELWEQGAVGIQEDPLPGGRCRLRAWFEHHDGLLERFHRFGPELFHEPERDWIEHSRQAWQPFALGRRLYLAPEWDESPTPPGRLRLTVHPGLALGTGAHAATQLCLEALEQQLHRGESLLDVGTGSGILAAAAIVLGAGFTAGCDIDAEAPPIARRNLLNDGMPARFFTGSTRALRDASFDVLTANINAATHRAAAAEYARVAKRLLILSGFPERHEAGVLEAFSPYCFSLQARLQREEWVCLSLLRDGIA